MFLLSYLLFGARRLWRAGLPLGIAALLLFSACEDKTSEVTLNVKNSNDLESAALTDTFTITGETYYYQSALSSNLGQVLAGQVYSPYTGLATAAGFMQVGLPARADTGRVPAAAIIDSLVVSFPWTVERRAGKTVRFGLFRLDKALPEDSIHFQSNSRSATAQLAEVSLNLDSIRRIPRLRFRVRGDNQLVTELGAYAKSGGLAGTQQGLDALVRGLAILHLDTGVLLQADLSGATAVLAYHLGNGTGADSGLTKALTLGTSQAHYTYIRNERIGETAGLTTGLPALNADQAGGRVYVQNGVSLWARLQVPGLAGFLAANPRLTILKAELLLPHAYGAQSTRRPPAYLMGWPGGTSNLYIGRNGILTDAFTNTGNGTGISRNIFPYDSAKAQITLDLTDYLYKVAKGTQVASGIVVSAPVGLPSLAPYIFSLSPADPRRARLRLYTVQQ